MEEPQDFDVSLGEENDTEPEETSELKRDSGVQQYSCPLCHARKIQLVWIKGLTLGLCCENCGCYSIYEMQTSDPIKSKPKEIGYCG